MKKQNSDIRLTIAACELAHKDVAGKLGIRPDSFSRLLAKPLSHRKRAEIQEAIEGLMTSDGEKHGKTD